MKILEILTQEHALILKAIECLSNARDMLEEGAQPPKIFFEKALIFLKTYADEFHHFKEEYLMFGLLAEKKNGKFDAEIGALRFQHEKGRSYLRNIEEALESYELDDEITNTLLLENLTSYISLLRRHIFLEDHVFFKMAKKSLDESDDEALAAHFQQEEEAQGGDHFVDKNRNRVEELQSILSRIKNG